MMLFIIGLIFCFIVPPLGVAILIIAILAAIIKATGKVVVGTGKVVVGTGKAVNNSINKKRCPYCISLIDKNAVICPCCKKEMPDTSQIEKRCIEIDKNNSMQILSEKSYSQINIPKSNYLEVCDNENEIKNYKENIDKIRKLFENNIYTKEEYENKIIIFLDLLMNNINSNDTKEQILMKLEPLSEEGYIREQDLLYIKANLKIDLSKINKEIFFETLMKRLKDAEYLYEKEIYTEIEYKESKDIWINSLELYKDITNRAEDIFLELIPFIQNKTLDSSEIEKIKYIVSGKYFEEIEKEAAESIRKSRAKKEAEKQRKKEENIKKIEKLKSEVNMGLENVINKAPKLIVNVKKNKCECGNEINKEAKFCRNCGKKYN